LRRAQVIRTASDWLRGRMALAVREPDDRVAAAVARRLRREGVSYAEVWSNLLVAGVASLRAEPERAAEALRAAIATADDAGMRMEAAAARRRLGALLGGDAGAAMVEEATAAMVSEEVRDADRMTALIVPGVGS
jgi:eukaryotic-like serine/threonine-protein kinase